MALTQIQQDGLSSNAFQAISGNIIALMPTLAGSGILIQANGQINSNVTLTLDTLRPFLTTSNVAEGSNLYYTNTRVVSAVLPYLTTSNVAEGSNLYYTNARVISAISGNVTVSALNVTNTTASTSKTTGALTVAGGLGVAGTIYGNRQDITGAFGNIYLTEYTGLYVQKDTGTGMIQLSTDRFANGIGWQVFSATDPAMYSSGNIYFRVGATLRDQDTISGGSTPVVIAPSGIFSTGVVSATGNVNAGNVIATAHQGTIWSGIYTANVIESSSNLYYTNTRVNSNVIAFLPSLAGQYINIPANGQINANLTTDSTIVIAANGQIRSNSSGGGGVTLVNNNTENSNTFYLLMSNTTVSGTLATVNLANTKLFFNPNTGTLNSTIFNSLSDETVKTNRQRIISALAKLSTLGGYTYLMIDSNEPSAGLLAQEVQKVLPEAVKFNPNTGLLSLNYNAVLGLVVEAINELEQRVSSLENAR